MNVETFLLKTSVQQHKNSRQRDIRLYWNWTWTVSPRRECQTCRKQYVIILFTYRRTLCQYVRSCSKARSIKASSLGQELIRFWSAADLKTQTRQASHYHFQSARFSSLQFLQGRGSSAFIFFTCLRSLAKRSPASLNNIRFLCSWKRLQHSALKTCYFQPLCARLLQFDVNDLEIFIAVPCQGFLKMIINFLIKVRGK